VQELGGNLFEVMATVARRVCLRLIMFASAGVLAAGSSAAASITPGVHIDPGSPVAKEYAIPLAQARGGAGGGGSASGQLFGSGITRAPRAASTSPVPAAGDGSVAVAPKPRRSVSLGGAGHLAAVPPPQLGGPDRTARGGAGILPGPDRNAGGGAGIIWMLGIAAAVLALGGLGGAALARFGRRTSARTS
jgi:hypothetical protein